MQHFIFGRNKIKHFIFLVEIKYNILFGQEEKNVPKNKNVSLESHRLSTASFTFWAAQVLCQRTIKLSIYIFFKGK
jgi:hypothetical protein